MWFMHDKASHYVVLCKIENNKFDEASSYHTKPFKIHVAVKEMINLRDEIEVIITQRYKKNQEMPDKKETGLKGNVEKFRNKKREWADTLNNNVIELKEDVDKIMKKNTCKEYMMINKKSCIRETKNLSTDADSRTDTILEIAWFFQIFALFFSPLRANDMPWKRWHEKGHTDRSIDIYRLRPVKRIGLRANSLTIFEAG